MAASKELIQSIKEENINAFTINKFYGVLKVEGAKAVENYAYQALNEEQRKELVTHKFRLLDDDGEVYAHGLASDEDTEMAFEPLDLAMGLWGCTEIQFKNKDGEWKTL